MKKKTMIIALTAMLLPLSGQAQLGGLLKKAAQKAVEKTTEKVVNKATEKASDAGGKAATAGCRAKLTELLTFIRANVLPVQTGVALPPESWSTNRLILSDANRQSLQAQAVAILQIGG